MHILSYEPHYIVHRVPLLIKVAWNMIFADEKMPLGSPLVLLFEFLACTSC